MSLRRPTSSPRRSWRETPARLPEATSRTGSKKPLIVVLTLAVLGLFAGFAWLLWQPVKSDSPTHFVALLTGESDLLSVPPVLFEEKTLAPLKGLDESGKSFVYVDASQAQHAGSSQAIESALEALPIRPDGRLVVYVSAHGVSDDGQPYVLAPDFDLRRPEEQRYPATSLIKAVSRINAETKLVVFDCSRLTVLPRMGMAANEFVSLVEQATQETGDRNLWIMTAGGELETSPLGLAEQRSILGSAIAEAIAGDADLAEFGGNGDYSVSLAELQEFVQQRLAGSRALAPIPRLTYSGGQSTPELLEERTVYQLRRYRAESEAPSSDKKEDKGQERVAVAKKPSVNVVAAKASVAGQAIQTTQVVNTSPTQSVKAQSTSARTSSAQKDGSQATSEEAPPTEQPAADKSKDDSISPKSDEPATPSGENGSGEQPSLAPDDSVQLNQPSDATQPLATPNAKVEKTSPIVEAWRSRDRLEAESAAGAAAASPAEYAPHLWNELNATLVAIHLEQLSLDSKSSEGAENEALIERFLHDLQQLADQRPVSDGGLVTDALGAALQEYMTSDQRRALNSLEAEYTQALRELRRSLSRLNHYMQWHAAMLGSVGDAGAASEGARLIRQVLEQLILLDRDLSELETTAVDAMDQARPQLRQLDASRRRVRELFAQLDRGVSTAAANLSQKQYAAALRQAENLLMTSLPSAEMRESLIATLRNRPDQDAGATAIETLPNWEGVFEHLRLEILLAQLVDPSAKSSPPFETVLSKTRVSGAPDAETRKLLRDAGKELQTFYTRLPDRIVDYRRSSRPEESRTADKMIAIVHPRDASSVLDENNAAIGFITPRWKPPGQLALAPPPQAVVNTQTWTPIRWSLNARHLAVSGVEVTIERFDSPLQVRFAGEREPARPGDSRRLQGNGALTLEAIATAPGDGSPASRMKELRIKVRARSDSGDRVFESQAQVAIPRPNRVVLTARCVDPERPQPAQGDQCLLLQPFPNRSTTFQFELANFSDEAKNLVVELVAIPSPMVINNRLADVGWPPGRMLDESGSVAPLLAQWANDGMKNKVTIASAVIALPPDEQRHPVELNSPVATPPPAPSGKEGDGPAAPAPDPPEPLAIDVTYGLACRVINKDRPEETWLTWLEVVPLRPTGYVDFNAEVVGREIRVTAGPNDANGDGQTDLPPGIVEKPIALVARGDDTVFQSGSVVPVNLGPASRTGLLTIQPLENVVGQPTVALEVDGFPRAVAWRVDLENQIASEVRNPASLNFERIGMPDPDATRSRLYRLAPYATHPPIDQKQWPIVVDSVEPICAFDISKGARPLELRFRADAARDAFNTVGGGNAIVLAWQEGIQAPTRLYDDRAVRSQVTEVTKTGELKIDSTVDDYTLSLPPPGVNDKAISLTARMSVQGAPDQVDSVMVVFDGRPPRIEATLDQPRIWEGTPRVGVTLDVEDLSGVARIEAWITEKPPRNEAELDPKTAQELAIPGAGPFRASEVELRRFALQAPAPPKEGSYWLTLRVTDGSGQQSTTLAQPMSLAVIKRPPPVVGPVIGDLNGVVMLGSKPGRNLTVTVKESPSHVATTDTGGLFVIKQIKAGKYTLVVSGRAGSGKVMGEHEITLAEKADYAGQLSIKAELQLAEPPKK